MTNRALASPIAPPGDCSLGRQFVGDLPTEVKTKASPLPKGDCIAPWFIAAEELGEFIGIRFGRLAPGSEEPDWTFLPHTTYDGIGGFAEILRRAGAPLERLPQLKHPVPPSWLALVRSLPASLRPRRPLKWAVPAPQPLPVDNQRPPPAVAWHVFDENTTTQVRRACRKSGVTINSFLVKHLTKAIRPFLVDHSSVVPWMLPVNVRGKIDLGRDTAPHTSYVGVKVRSYETVQDVHRNIYTALGRGEHWANWHMYTVTRPLTAGLRRLMLAKGLATSQWFVGSFSNLGDWDPERKLTQPGCLGSWLFTPLSFDCLKVAAGCVTFQNRLSVTIQLHPNLATDCAVPKAWVLNWTKEIEIDLASLLERSAPTDR